MADDLNGFAEQVGEDVGDIRGRVAPVQKGADDDFRVTDQEGRVALGVTPTGSVMLGGTEHRTDQPGYRVMDQEGRVAFEVDADGRTHIYDGHASGGGGEITTLHVFIAAGQSNMSGRGLPAEGPQSPRIMQFGANRRVIEQAPVVLDMVDTPPGTSPALFFAHNYLAAQPDHVGVLLIPAARGGTGFTWDETADRYTWTNGTAIDPEHALYERSVEQTLDAITAAKAEGYHVIVKGVLWHQGEANGGVATETYATYLDRLIADYRADLDHPTLPFMAGQMCIEGMEDGPAKYTVDEAHQDTPYRTGFTGFAPSTRDGHNPGDTTHFSTVGTAHLGDTYVTAYIQALGNTHQNVTIAPEPTTGWIDLTDQISEPVTSGRLLIKRTGARVTIALEELQVDASGNWGMPRLDTAYRPAFRVQENWFIANSSQPPVGVVNISSAGYFNVYNTDPSHAMVARIEYETEREFAS